MNKVELAAAVAEAIDIPKSTASSAVDVITKKISEALSCGDAVRLTGFGSFEVKERAARKGRNPKTGESIDIAAQHQAVFRPGKDLKERINAAR